MNVSERLSDYADECGIVILETTLEGGEDALSVELGDRRIIALNRLKVCSEADRAVKCAHEIGHCETGAFYNQFSPFCVRCKAEYKADKWAACKLIPIERLQAALRCGLCDLWELAESFGVTEQFVVRTIYIYKCMKLL